MGLFNNYNALEEQLLEHYSQFLTEMGLPDAKKTAKQVIDQAIEESKKDGTYNILPNFGDILLQREKTDDNTRSKLEKKRKEGVRDEDIRWWWNLNDIERRVMLKVNEFHQLTLFVKSLEDGLSEDDALNRVSKYHPLYGDPADTSQTTSEDRPIPFELKNRVDIYINKRFATDNEKYKKEIEASSTFNAFLRKEIKAGNL